MLKKNEQYDEVMTDICMFLNQYVPGAREENDPRALEKILSGGDYLTFERHKQAQSAKRNGRTPMKRMEGLVPKLEEFYNQAEFLQVKYLTLADILVPCNAFFFKTIKDMFMFRIPQLHTLFYKKEFYCGKFIFQQNTLIRCKVNIL